MKNWVFDDIDKIDKPLGRLSHKEIRRTQISKTRHENTSDTREI
jgi:hypothetical protein